MQDASNTDTYDSQNQMISSLSRSSGILTCYFYDAYGRRVQKATGATSCGYPFVGGTSLYYVYDTAGNMIDEVSAPSGGTGNWTRQEIYAAGRHLATFYASAGQAYWDFSDWLGTERARVNAVTGAVAETCTSLPWGDNLQCTGTDQSPLHFTGKQRDSESGLDNFGARYFGSSLGRFMSPDDPFADQRPGDPQSWNLYSYVRNNPLSNTDPSGNVCVSDGYGGWIDEGNLGQTCAESFDPSQMTFASATDRTGFFVPTLRRVFGRLLPNEIADSRELIGDFVSCYHAENRDKRKEKDNFKSFSYDDLVKRDKANLDIFWLRDESLEDSANLPDPDVIAAEIAVDLQAALDQFSRIMADMES